MKKTNLIISSSCSLVLYLLPLISKAQDKETIFKLPGNEVIAADKLDSVAKAWGGNERLAFFHSTEDDKKHIMHLQRITDEELKATAERKALRAAAVQNMMNKPAPDWSVKDIDGKTWSLESLKGKVVVMNFWFTSCSPCIREMPHLNELVAQYADKAVVFIAFAPNDETGIRAFLEKRPFNYIQVPDSQSVGELYGIDSWPTSFVIDKEGKIRLVVNYDENILKTISGVVDTAL